MAKYLTINGKINIISLKNYMLLQGDRFLRNISSAREDSYDKFRKDKTEKKGFAFDESGTCRKVGSSFRYYQQNIQWSNKVS